MIDLKKFNFLPQTYEKIAYRHEDTLTITTPGNYETETIYSSAGFYIPIVLISLDGQKWFNADYPPRSNTEAPLADASVSVYSDGFNILATRSTAGTLYYRVLGIRI